MLFSAPFCRKTQFSLSTFKTIATTTSTRETGITYWPGHGCWFDCNVDFFPLPHLVEQNESKHDGSPSPGMTDQEKEVAASAYEAFVVIQHFFKHWHLIQGALVHGWKRGVWARAHAHKQSYIWGNVVIKINVGAWHRRTVQKIKPCHNHVYTTVLMTYVGDIDGSRGGIRASALVWVWICPFSRQQEFQFDWHYWKIIIFVIVVSGVLDMWCVLYLPPLIIVAVYS